MLLSNVCFSQSLYKNNFVTITSTTIMFYSVYFDFFKVHRGEYLAGSSCPLK